jgi:hypothetical protein
LNEIKIYSNVHYRPDVFKYFWNRNRTVMKRFFHSIIRLVTLGLFLTHAGFAQNKTVSGIVTTFDSITVTNATIRVKSTGTEVKSDSTGYFRVETGKTDKLRVSAGGFFDRQVKIKAKTKIALVNIKLKPGEENREIAVGYGYVKDKDKLYAVSTLNSEDLSRAHYNSIFEMIQGRIPGFRCPATGRSGSEELLPRPCWWLMV